MLIDYGMRSLLPDLDVWESGVQLQLQTMQQQSQMAQQQCDESKRIIAGKKRRTILNDGERAELQRFEDNIRARCS